MKKLPVVGDVLEIAENVDAVRELEVVKLELVAVRDELNKATKMIDQILDQIVGQLQLSIRGLACLRTAAKPRAI